MSGKIWAAGAVLAIVLANTGCVSCCSTTYPAARKSAPDCELPSPCRGNVYVYMIHGATPSTDCGLEVLREKLAESGFAKVGVGELASAPCVYFDIKDRLKCEPDARFVLLGYDLGAPAAVGLARELVKKKVPVEAVVLLDPLGCGAEPAGVPTLVVTSCKAACSAPHAERVAVPDVGHFKLPTHPATVSAITDLLKDIAARNCHPPEDELQEWGYRYAPPMRPVPRGRGGEWDFLADRDGAPSPIGTQVVAKPAPANPTPAASASPRPSPFAGAVMLPK